MMLAIAACSVLHLSGSSMVWSDFTLGEASALALPCAAWSSVDEEVGVPVSLSGRSLNPPFAGTSAS
eukprot:1623653-Rhodomonas_salina.3